jgi:DNA-directed RNA polymerase specialized sigma24 family protein
MLRNFREQHEGSFLGFITVITANVVRDHFKATVAVKRGSGIIPASLDVPEANEPPSRRSSDPEDIVLLSQIQDWLSNHVANERDRLVFSLHYRGGLTAKEISSLPGISLSTKGVESLLCRLINHLRAQLAPPNSVRPSTNPEGLLGE